MTKHKVIKEIFIQNILGYSTRYLDVLSLSKKAGIWVIFVIMRICVAGSFGILMKFFIYDK